MIPTILQINLTYTTTPAELESIFAHAVGAIATFPGLVWKIWIVNDDLKTAGGIYCFEDATALTNYLNSPIVAMLKANPLLTQVDIKPFAAIAHLSAQTGAPLPALSPF